MDIDSQHKLTEEQKMLSDSVARYLGEEYDFESRRVIANGTTTQKFMHWKAFAKMGWLSLPFSEADGGFNGGAKELSILFEAFGENLVLEPYLDTILLAGGALSAGSEAVKKKYLPDIINGELFGAFAHIEPKHTAERFHVGTMALRADDHWQLNGVKSVVSNGPYADFLIVSARISGKKNSRDGIALFAMNKNTPGVQCDDYVTIDGRRASEITFSEVKLDLDALISSDSGILDKLLDRACFAVCAEALGAMRRLVAMTIDYCQQRKQFGQPIGSFQVLQHRMVDMYIALELSQSLLLATANAISVESDDQKRLLSALKFKVDKSARIISYGAVQLHGGIAMTDEFAVGHYFKRLTLIGKQFGNADFHLERYRNYNAVNTSAGEVG